MIAVMAAMAAIRATMRTAATSLPLPPPSHRRDARPRVPSLLPRAHYPGIALPYYCSTRTVALRRCSVPDRVSCHTTSTSSGILTATGTRA